MTSLLETLALILLTCPAILGMGLSLESMCDGCDCEQQGSVVCANTICSNGGPLGTPTQYQIDISGFADDNCSGCSSIDGSYTVVIADEGAICNGTQHGLGWSAETYVETIMHCCTGAPSEATVSLRWTDGGSSMSVVVATTANLISCPGAPTNSYAFRYDSAPVDCSALSSLAFPWLSNTGGGGGADAACDGSGATVEVTTL